MQLNSTMKQSLHCIRFFWGSESLVLFTHSLWHYRQHREGSAAPAFSCFSLITVAWSWLVLVKNPEFTPSETRTRPSENAFGSEMRRRPFKKCSRDPNWSWNTSLVGKRSGVYLRWRTDKNRRPMLLIKIRDAWLYVGICRWLDDDWRLCIWAGR